MFGCLWMPRKQTDLRWRKRASNLRLLSVAQCRVWNGFWPVCHWAGLRPCVISVQHVFAERMRLSWSRERPGGEKGTPI